MPTFPGTFPATDSVADGETVEDIITEGLLMAGDTGLADRAETFLKAWLKSQYDSYPWPFLHREKTGLALGTGVQSVTLGYGVNGVAERIRRILDPIRVYNSSYSARSIIRVRQLTAGTLQDEDMLDPTTNRGMPSLAKIEADSSSWGKWNLVFDVAADRDYLLKVMYLISPADPALTDIPLYPNPRTMMKAVEVEVLRYKRAANYQAEREVLAKMTVDDRLRYGDVAGTNDSLSLDPNVFR